MREEKYCAGCMRSRPVGDFGRNGSRADGLQSQCKECKRRHRNLVGRRTGRRSEGAATRRVEDNGLTVAERQRLVEENRGLVGMLARERLDRGLTFRELESAGYEGLCYAATKYDPGRGLKFATYASHWVRQAFSDELRRNRLIRLPPKRPAGEAYRGQYDRIREARMVRIGERRGGIDPPDQHEEASPLDDRLAWLEGTMRQLPPDCRKVLEGRMAGRSQDDIAAEFGYGRMYVRGAEARAVRYLRAMLWRRGGP